MGRDIVTGAEGKVWLQTPLSDSSLLLASIRYSVYVTRLDVIRARQMVRQSQMRMEHLRLTFYGSWCLPALVPLVFTGYK